MHKIKTDNKEFTLSYKGENLCKKCPWSCNEAKNFYPFKIIKCTGYDNIINESERDKIIEAMKIYCYNIANTPYYMIPIL